MKQSSHSLETMHQDSAYDHYLSINVLHLKWSMIFVVTGGLIFWIGAFTPPWKQWYTADLIEYLNIIDNHKINWYFIHGTMLLGVLISLFGLLTFSISAKFSTHGSLMTNILVNAYAIATILLIISFAFRLTVTMWVAEWLSATGSIETLFKPLLKWNNFLFSAYMMLSFLSITLWGLALRDIAILPTWTSWFCLVFGLLGLLGFPSRIPFFEPPLIIHLPFIIVGSTAAVKLRGY